MDERKALSRDCQLTIKCDQSNISVCISDVIGMGGSCIVYKARKQMLIGGETRESDVIVKEFYPAGMEIARESDGRLVASDHKAFEKRKKYFGGRKGWKYHNRQGTDRRL